MPTFIPWLRNRAEVRKKENSQDKKLIFVLLKSLMSLLVNYNSFKYIGCLIYNNIYIKDYVKVKHTLKYVGKKNVSIQKKRVCITNIELCTLFEFCHAVIPCERKVGDK